jgi:hypothetical protein
MRLFRRPSSKSETDIEMDVKKSITMYNLLRMWEGSGLFDPCLKISTFHNAENILPTG